MMLIAVTYFSKKKKGSKGEKFPNNWLKKEGVMILMIRNPLGVYHHELDLKEFDD